MARIQLLQLHGIKIIGIAKAKDQAGELAVGPVELEHVSLDDVITPAPGGIHKVAVP